jgi:hypothetical protein
MSFAKTSIKSITPQQNIFLSISKLNIIIILSTVLYPSKVAYKLEYSLPCWIIVNKMKLLIRHKT